MRSGDLPLPAPLAQATYLHHHRGQIRTKLGQLRDAAAVGDWPQARWIASRFKRLGNEAAPFSGRTNASPGVPRSTAQLGRDLIALIAAGIAALRRRYGLS